MLHVEQKQLTDKEAAEVRAALRVAAQVWNGRGVNDGQRTIDGLKKIEGKRMTLRQPRKRF